MWDLLGTFLPILGMLAVALSAVFFRRGRWWILFFGPLLVLFLCFALLPWLADNGNLLYMTLFVGLYAGLGVYYLVLCVVAGIVFYRRVRPEGARGPSRD
jgi:hypothetical protein